MNLPNKLTISRIGLTVVFMFFLFGHGVIYKVLALATFMAAAATDYLDGHIAKKRGLISDFGRFMDPIADKCLTLSAFLTFVEMKLAPAWMVMIIIFRELVITGMRIIALRRSQLIEATLGGKHKTASQMFSIVTILVFLVFRELGYGLKFWTGSFEYYFALGIFCLMFVTVTLTLISGASFFMRNKGLFYPQDAKLHEKKNN